MPIGRRTRALRGLVIDPHWVNRGLAFAIVDGGRGFRDVKNSLLPSSDSSTYAIGNRGPARDYTGAQVSEFSDSWQFRLNGALTLISGLDIDAFTNYTAIAFKQQTYWKSSFEWRHGRVNTSSADPAGAQAVLIRGNDSVLSEYCSTDGPTTTGRRVAAVSVADASLLTAPVFYVDGKRLTTGTASSSAGTVVDGGALRIGQRYDGAVQLDGRMEFLYGFAAQLSDIEIAILSASPSRLFMPQRRFIPPAGTATAVPTITFVGAENITSTSADYRVTLDFA